MSSSSPSSDQQDQQQPQVDLPTASPLASHPVFDPLSSYAANNDLPSSGNNAGSDPASSSELACRQVKLRKALRHFADFPIKGIDFVDVMPLFADPDNHSTLLEALVLQAESCVPGLQARQPAAPVAATADPPKQPTADVVVVGLDARGFLFGPGLALRLGLGFAPVRKKGKLPGPCVTAEYKKEYGSDFFQMQQDAVKPGQNVIIVDDIIATGECITRISHI